MQPRRCVEAFVQEDAVDDEAHEKRLHHLEGAGDERQQKHRPDRVSMRSQPVQIVANVFASVASLGRRRRLPVVSRRRRRVSALRAVGLPVVVEPAMPVVLDKPAIAVA